MQKGQTLLITLLILGVTTTVALSLIGRATSDVSVTRQLEESSRAFIAAEAGVEEALRTKEGSTMTIDAATNTTVTTSIAQLGDSQEMYTLDRITQMGESEMVWLTGHNADGTLNESDPNRYQGGTIDVCWEHSATIPALEIAVVYKNGSEYEEIRGAYDPNTPNRANNFSAVTDGEAGCGLTGVYRQTVTIPSAAGIVPLFLRIRPYYTDAKIMVSPIAQTIPTQGSEVTSTGTTGDGVTRKVVVKQQFETYSLPFDYALYSEEDLRNPLWERYML